MTTFKQSLQRLADVNLQRKLEDMKNKDKKHEDEVTEQDKIEYHNMVMEYLGDLNDAPQVNADEFRVCKTLCDMCEVFPNVIKNHDWEDNADVVVKFHNHKDYHKVKEAREMLKKHHGVSLVAGRPDVDERSDCWEAAFKLHNPYES